MSIDDWLSRVAQAIDVPAPFRSWRIDLATDLPDAGSILSVAELVRARRFVFERDRRRYRVAHGALRALLARAVSSDARSLKMVENPHGKPWLSDHPELGFSLSHSGDVALVAHAWGNHVGVDVEVRAARFENVDDLARSHFSTAEREALQDAPPAAREDVFLRVWTRKEACTKALGTGLSEQLPAIDVGEDGAQRWVRVPDVRGFVDVSVESIDAGADVVAALAHVARTPK